ncbi:MAG: hypothetical protein HY313_11735 [Acidobacteria bacterium]|nr:hypothetical protein [Acidobacteriota bacterium]
MKFLSIRSKPNNQFHVITIAFLSYDLPIAEMWMMNMVSPVISWMCRSPNHVMIVAGRRMVSLGGQFCHDTARC